MYMLYTLFCVWLKKFHFIVVGCRRQSCPSFPQTATAICIYRNNSQSKIHTIQSIWTVLQMNLFRYIPVSSNDIEKRNLLFLNFNINQQKKVEFKNVCSLAFAAHKSIFLIDTLIRKWVGRGLQHCMAVYLGFDTRTPNNANFHPN